MMQTGAKRWLIAAVASPLRRRFVFSAHFNRYYLGIAIDVGISIILAVSLNLINGHTGQFSLGHAGFMAVGGFTAARLTLSFCKLASRRKAQPVAFFVGSMLLGGLIARR
jgi:branched-chain amino acid transport system permease protein